MSHKGEKSIQWTRMFDGKNNTNGSEIPHIYDVGVNQT
jgi:hypothetical protein